MLGSRRKWESFESRDEIKAGVRTFEDPRIGTDGKTASVASLHPLRSPNIKSAIILFLSIIAGGFLIDHINAQPEIFTNTFLVKMRLPADMNLADRVAARNGFDNLGPVS